MVYKTEQLETSGERKAVAEVKWNHNYSWIFHGQYLYTIMERALRGLDGGD